MTDADARGGEAGARVTARTAAGICLFLALALVAGQAAVLFGGRTLIPLAPSLGIVPGAPYGYRGPVADSPITADPSGAFDVGLAFDAYSARALRQGSLPFWNPYQGLGEPFLANGLSAVLYPLNWLHLLLPPAWWDLVYLANWLAAAALLAVALRALDLDTRAALVAGLAVLGSGYFQIYAALREVPATAAWWPLLLCAVEVGVRRRAGAWRPALLALPICATLCGGQPEVAFFSLLAALAFGIARCAAEGAGAARALAALVPGSVAGLLLAAPAWLPFADYAASSYSAHPAGSGYGDVRLPLTSLATYVFPDLWGRLYGEPYGAIEGWAWNHSPGWLPAVALFLASHGLVQALRRRRVAPTFFAGVALVVAGKIWGVPPFHWLGRLPVLELLIFPRYAGFLLAFSLCALAALGFRDLSQEGGRGWWRWLGVWSGVAIAVFAGGTLPLLPRLSGGAVAYFAAFGGLGLAWALGTPAALAWVAARRPGRPNSLLLLVAMGILLQASAHAANGQPPAVAALASLCGLAIYAALAAVMLLRETEPRRGSLAVIGLAAVALQALYAVLPDFGLPARYDPMAPVPYLAKLAALQDEGLYRSYSLGSMPHPNFAAAFGISSINTNEALQPAGSAGYLSTYLDRGADPILFEGRRPGARDPRFPAVAELRANARWFDLAAVRFVTDAPSSPDIDDRSLVGIYSDDTGVAIWERPTALSRAFLATEARLAPSAEVALQRLAELPDPTRSVWIEEGPELAPGGTAAEAPGRVTSFRLEPNDVWIGVEAKRAVILVLADSYDPGWRAERDGEPAPVLRVDGVFRGVRVPGAGAHEVHFRYRPRTWTPALALAALGALLLLGSLGYARRARRATVSDVE